MGAALKKRPNIKSNKHAPPSTSPVPNDPPKREETTEIEATPQPPEDGEDPITQAHFIEYYEPGPEIISWNRFDYSVAYEAKEWLTGQTVAIQPIRLEEDYNLDELKRTARISKQINHPNITRLHRVFLDDQILSLVMEFVQGDLLRQRILDRGRYSERQSSNVIRQIVAAVDYLHSAGIALHNPESIDSFYYLNLENILSFGDFDNEVIKIVDLGLLRKDDHSRLTACYAPEALTGESFDKSADMWSVGAILYFS